MKYACWIVLFMSFVSLNATVYSDGYLKPNKPNQKTTIKVEEKQVLISKDSLEDDLNYNSEKDTILGDVVHMKTYNLKELALKDQGIESHDDLIVNKPLKLEWSVIALVTIVVFSIGLAFSVFLSNKSR